MRQFLLLVLVVVTTGPVVSKPPKKEPWMYTLEERIALRTNPELARERVRAAKRADAARGTPSSVEHWDDFNGKTHPEVYLPTEVFRTLIDIAFSPDPRSTEFARQAHMEAVRCHGLPPDFWERLRAISTIYIADDQAAGDLGKSLVEEQLSDHERKRIKEALTLKQRDVCRSLADAVEAARDEFGRERFDRFLYETIAPYKFTSMTATQVPTAEGLRWVAGGCR